MYVTLLCILARKRAVSKLSTGWSSKHGGSWPLITRWIHPCPGVCQQMMYVDDPIGGLHHFSGYLFRYSLHEVLKKRWKFRILLLFLYRFRSIRIWKKARAVFAARNRASTSAVTLPVSATIAVPAGSWITVRTRLPATTSLWCATTRPTAARWAVLRQAS